MESARPLRDLFADLTGAGNTAGDPGELLRDQGHPALPDDLVAEAVISYADTAPAEVAEHLAPYVTAHSVVGAEDVSAEPPGWLDLMATAPAGEEPGDIDDLTPVTGELGPDDGAGLDFGTGTETGPEFEALDDAAPEETDETVETVDDDFLELGTDPIDLDSDDVADWDDAEADDDEPDTEGLG